MCHTCYRTCMELPIEIDHIENRRETGPRCPKCRTRLLNSADQMSAKPNVSSLINRI